MKYTFGRRWLVLNWNNIWESTISGIFVVIFGGISAWLAYILGIRGKEKSQIASRRKQEIYIPLKYECFLLGKHTVERVCSGLSPLRRDRLWC